AAAPRYSVRSGAARRGRKLPAWRAKRNRIACAPSGDGTSADENALALEHWMRGAVAGGNAELARGAADDFENRAHRPARGNDPLRHRRGVLGNAQDAAVAADEQHVERDVSVAHPHRDVLILLEVEQHAASLRQ